MASASHGAGPSAVGYQHQTWWALVELLGSGAARPDAAITLEMHDDVAWEQDGSPTQLLQVKHHQNTTHRALTDASTDLWRTLAAWMDTAVPGDASGPRLLLITTQTAAPGTAVAALRPETLDARAALGGLEAVASAATSEQTRKARERFLALSPSDRRTFLSRIRVVDGSPRIDEVSMLVRTHLRWALPIGHEELFLALVWRWWDEQALAMLQGRLRSVDVGVAQAAIADIRDQFTCEGLPTLVELQEVDASTVAEYRTHMFVQQMQWVAYPPRNLQKAIVDYYRAYTQTVRWLDEDLIGLAELAKFEAELVDEWEREFDWMLDTLDDDADEATKQKAGKQMLRQLLSQTGIAVRARYNEPFFARGERHVLADAGRMGWHPEFESRIQELLQVSA